jgi:16S rRNA (guanine527-N7)-methyltransferase
VVDIGAGGGFPGIIWKILRSEIALTLVERKYKKAAFLERAVVVLRLNNVEVVAKDALETANKEKYRRKYDVAVSLAVGPTERLFKAVESFLRKGGYYCSVRPTGEKARPARIGSSLVLRETETMEKGMLYLYQLE